MAKVTDLNRAHVIIALNCLIDQKGNRILSVGSWSDLKIKFGKENRKGIARAQVVIKIYDKYYCYTYTFDLFYDFIMEDWHHCPCVFKSVLINKEFSSSRLISIDNFKLNGLWQEEEEGVGDVVPVIDSPVEVLDGKFESVIL